LYDEKKRKLRSETEAKSEDYISDEESNNEEQLGENSNSSGNGALVKKKNKQIEQIDNKFDREVNLDSSQDRVDIDLEDTSEESNGSSTKRTRGDVVEESGVKSNIDGGADAEEIQTSSKSNEFQVDSLQSKSNESQQQLSSTNATSLTTSIVTKYCKQKNLIDYIII
jgi:hypothetical protein